MKFSKALFLLMIVSFLSSQALGGTSNVVFQNAVEGGYQGTQDSWIDTEDPGPNGDNEITYLLWEECAT